MSNESGRRNALAGESSPYLLLHQHNPVDWYPWGEEALARAVEEDRPIFLSIGYSTCYWCHVMERESFSEPAIAALMNEHFVNIKVDREERPDLDEIYMVATQILTHQGGWPNSVFLTPELEPFFAGTYFPPEDRHGRPGFPTVLHSLADAWVSRRDDVGEQGASVISAIRHYLEERSAPSPTPPGGEPAERSLRSLERQFDPRWGGFGGAPKFPSVPNLWLIEAFADENADARRMLEVSLDQMARGGIYDQLAGGFHRYATDAEWKIPHFEKMLYDNGLLLELYARDAERNRNPQSERIVRETVAFLEREMRSEVGAFWSAIDAETDGAEGAYYVWTQDELVAILGREDAAFLAPLLGFEGAPFFEGRHFVLHWPAALEEQAVRRQIDAVTLLAEVRPMLDRILAARAGRIRPLTDEKILADWNGAAIAGLAEAGRVLGDESAVALAAAAADAVLSRLRSAGGVLLHAWRDGAGRVEAFLSDYAFLARGLLALARATGDSTWLDRAIELVGEQEERLASLDGAYFAAEERRDLVVRSQDVYDGALPSSSGVALLNLLELVEQTGDRRWYDRAARGLSAHGALIEERPDAARTLALAARRSGAHGAAQTTEVSPADRVFNGEVFDREVSNREVANGEVSNGRAAASDEIVSARLELGAVDAGRCPFEVVVTIASGWHVYAHEQELAWVHGTELSAHGAELESVEYPPAEPGAKDGVGVYRGRWVITGRLRRTVADAHLALSCQPCDESRCLEPVLIEIGVGLEGSDSTSDARAR